MSSEDPEDPVEALRRRRARVHEEMGGAAKVARLREQGRLDVRTRITTFADPGSLLELGTFVGSDGDGLIGGHATRDGRPVTLAGDDVTVKRATSAPGNQARLHRLFTAAERRGNPFVFFGERGGARLPDTLGSTGFTRIADPDGAAPHLSRRRRIPLATAIVGESFGQSSLIAASSDFVVQLRGAVYGLTSPRVVAAATGASISMEALAGADVSLRRTGQIDAIAETDEEVAMLIGDFLGYLPPNADERPPVRDAPQPRPDAELGALVPAARRRGYDMTRVLRRVLDDGVFLQLRPGVGRGLICALGRIGGRPVGVLASQPKYDGGTLTPATCDKTVRLLCLCDAFNLPVVSLIDTPGLLVGPEVEQDRLLQRASAMLQAFALSRTPKIAVIVRKAFGVGYLAMGGASSVSNTVLAWPGAEISFMDPGVGANVLNPGASDAERATEIARLSRDTDPYGAAAAMNVDEVIDPADTRALLARLVADETRRSPVPHAQRPLASWPMGW